MRLNENQPSTSTPTAGPVRLLSSIVGPATPFEADGRFERAAPFLFVAVLGATSLALPPGPQSVPDAVAAISLLLLTAIGFVLPWSRLPSFLTVLVPLAYTASVLMTVLATGSSTSGIGVLVLVPLIWTALYHRQWESFVIVVAVVAFQIYVSLTPLVAADAVILRRAVFWAMLGSLLSVATHRLREVAGSQVLAREEDLRRTVALERATEELTAILDPDEVVTTATRLAAELASPPGTPGRRAQYCRVENDVVSFAGQYDETGRHVSATFALEDHPNLLSVYLSHEALSSRVDARRAGPSVSSLIEMLGVTHSVYVPILRDDLLDGILIVSVRGAELPLELFELCKAFGHVFELSLANAWAHRDLGRQATTDSMTGLPNRRGYETFLEHRPGRREYVVLAIDVDGLKPVNDALGHDAGDALLVHISQCAKRALRRGDVIARLGGDEFAAYLVDASESDGRRVAARMLTNLAEDACKSAAGVSIGVAVGTSEGDVREVHAAADAAMYAAKRAGGRRYEVARPTAARSGTT